MTRKKGGRKALSSQRKKEVDVLSPQERVYVKLRASGLSEEEAYSLAFNEQGDGVKYKAGILESRHDIISELQRIKEELKAEIVKEAPDAFQRLVELAKYAKSEKVRLEANRDILNRAGFNEPVQLKQFALFAFMTPEQIKEFLRAQMMQALRGVESGKEVE